MNKRAAIWPRTQQTFGGKPQGGPNSNWAGITNPVLNQSPAIRRKDADRLVNLGRAEWVAPNQLRLVLSHPANQSAAARASQAYDAALYTPTFRGGIRPDLEELRRRDPKRYAALWRGKTGARPGKGAVGKITIDRALHFKQRGRTDEGSATDNVSALV